MARALRRVEVAACDCGDGERALHAALRELTRSIAERPREALVLVHVYAAGPTLRERIPRTTASFERLLAQTLATLPGWTAVPPRMTRAMVAGITHLVRTRLLLGRGAKGDAGAADVATQREVADGLARWILSLLGACALRSARPLATSSTVGGRRSASAVLRAEAGGERGRVLAAAARIGASEGYAALTVPKIRTDAGVPAAPSMRISLASMTAS